MLETNRGRKRKRKRIKKMSVSNGVKTVNSVLLTLQKIF
jgi:hypothetical protein